MTASPGADTVSRVAAPLTRTAAVLSFLLFLLATAPELSRAVTLPVGRISPCPDGVDAVAVDTDHRELWLCRGGAAEARFSVALGRRGVDKHRLGDQRTPRGAYPLGDPRPSRRFGTFIPIGYPTAEQSARGFTGGAVGIHGPPRGMAEPEYPTTGVDWTKGCIATGTDAEVDAIARFVRERQPIALIR